MCVHAVAMETWVVEGVYLSAQCIKDIVIITLPGLAPKSTCKEYNNVTIILSPLVKSTA